MADGLSKRAVVGKRTDGVICLRDCSGRIEAAQRHAARGQRAHLVVFVAGHDDTQDTLQNGSWTSILSEASQNAERSGLQQLVLLATAHGAHLDLFTLPCTDINYAQGGPLAPADSPQRRAIYNRLLREVAAANPHAWIRQARTPDEIVTPGPANLMVSFPYPKLCTANMQVDQGAAYIVCSAAAARAAGVPEERWVFPLSGADGNDHWFISDRPELHRSPAIGLAGAAALEGAGDNGGNAFGVFTGLDFERLRFCQVLPILLKHDDLSR